MSKGLETFNSYIFNIFLVYVLILGPGEHGGAKLIFLKPFYKKCSTAKTFFFSLVLSAVLKVKIGLSHGKSVDILRKILPAWQKFLPAAYLLGSGLVSENTSSLTQAASTCVTKSMGSVWAKRKRVHKVDLSIYEGTCPFLCNMYVHMPNSDQYQLLPVRNMVQIKSGTSAHASLVSRVDID